jgi:hypothetical protein
MLRIPKDAALTAHPQEVGPSRLWNERDFMDFGAIEKQLAKLTFKFHRLLSDRFPNLRADDVDHILPIAFFDCFTNVPECEVALKEHGIPYRGTTRIWCGDDSFQWVPCTITSLDEKSMSFSMTFDKRVNVFNPLKPATKEISRFSIHFDGEDLSALSERRQIAEDVRFSFEQTLRTLIFLEVFALPSNILSFLPPSIQQSAPADAVLEAERTQKMHIVRGLVQMEQEPRLEQTLRSLGVDLSMYAAMSLKTPLILSTDFHQMRSA